MSHSSTSNDDSVSKQSSHEILLDDTTNNAGGALTTNNVRSRENDESDSILATPEALADDITAEKPVKHKKIFSKRHMSQPNIKTTMAYRAAMPQRSDTLDVTREEDEALEEDGTEELKTGGMASSSNLESLGDNRRALFKHKRNSSETGLPTFTGTT